MAAMADVDAVERWVTCRWVKKNDDLAYLSIVPAGTPASAYCQQLATLASPVGAVVPPANSQSRGQAARSLEAERTGSMAGIQEWQVCSCQQRWYGKCDYCEERVVERVSSR